MKHPVTKLREATRGSNKGRVVTSARPAFDYIALETPDDLKPLMEYWRRSTYLQQRRLRLRNTEQLSRFLYKYRGFSGEHDEQNLREMIVYSVLRLTAPATFNDPFEMFVHLVVEGSREQRQRRFSEMAAQQAPNTSPDQRADMVRLLMETPDLEHSARCQESIGKIKTGSGVFCFAGDPRSVLMWSHYAENHRGVCLQFERMKDFITLGHAVRVDYREELPVVNWIVDFHAHAKHILLAKHPSWEYEEERRITSVDNANRHLQLRPDALTGVIFGCRIQRARMEFIDALLDERKALGAPPVKTYLATQHKTKYRLVIRDRHCGGQSQ